MAPDIIDGNHGWNIAKMVWKKHFARAQPCRLVSHFDARDVIMAGLERGYRDLKRWKPDCGTMPESWFYNSCRRGMQDFLRDQRPGRRNPVEGIRMTTMDANLNLDDQGGHSKLTLADLVPDVRVDVEREALNTVGLDEALESLNPRTNSIVRMYHQQDMTQREIGELLGVTESRINQILQEAYKTMRNQMTTITNQERTSDS